MVMAVIQDGKAVSDVAQENNVHPNMILNWKKEFLENAAMIFDRHRPDITEKAQRCKIEELETKLKKKDEAELGKEKVSLKTRTLIETEVQKIHEKTEIKVSELVAFAGVSKSTWHEWKSRKGIETRHNHETPKLNWYTPEERMAVVKYVLAHKNFLYGYRYLAWQMIDDNVAFVRPASVYNIMKEYDLVHKWAKNEGEAKKKGFDQPSAPHEQWHTDISYIKVLGVFYYFISIMDGYSRKILD